MTAVAAVRLGDGLTAPFTIDCPMDGEVFGVYVARACWCRRCARATLTGPYRVT
jgi:hypothetical protein